MSAIAQTYFDLRPEDIVALSPQELFDVAGDEVGKRWHKIAEDAAQFMASRHGDKTLIVVCAQHPLKNGLEPGDEFRLRLQAAVDARDRIQRSGDAPLPLIYVPGSIHTPDKVNLAAAGVAWLAAQGVTYGVYGEDVNEVYKGAYSEAVHKGVYGCCDEAYVAACIVKQDSEIGKVILIASVNQSLRMQVHMLANGIIPSEIITIMPENSYHAPVTEVRDNLPSVLLAQDPTFQSAAEDVPKILRKLRVPGLS